MIDNFYECILIVSNYYTQLCEMFYHQKKDKYLNPEFNEIIELDLAYKIIDKLVDNAKKQNKIPKLILLGADSISVQETTLAIIQYCRNLDTFIEITLQIENVDKTVNFFEINNLIRTYNLQIDYIYNDFTEDSIQILIEDNPYMNIYLPINWNNYLSLTKIYYKLNDLKVKKLKILFNYYELNRFKKYSNFQMDLLLDELTEINNFIYDNFQNNNIPLIPFNFSINFIMILMNNIETENEIQYLSTGDCVKRHCKMVLGERIIINQKGELYLCSHEDFIPLNKKAYCGYIHLDDNFEVEDLNIFKKIYNYDLIEDYRLYPNSDPTLDCDHCTRVTTCSTGCFCNNLIGSDFALNPVIEYCLINRHIKELMEDLVKKLNEQENELFKEYFYLTCQRGTDGL